MLALADEADQRLHEDQTVLRGHLRLFATIDSGQSIFTRLIASFDRATAPYDCVLMPSVPIVAPRIADLDDERAYNSVNMLILRNTALGNFFDRCAISVPCHREGEAPVGLMLMGETLGDARLFAIAAAVETALAT